jgi:hypothetical protein
MNKLWTNIKGWARLGLILLVVAVALELVQAQPSPGDKPECLTAEGSPNLDVPNIAANCPDLFAWTKFIEVNSPATENPDYVTWQLWTTDPLTFPSRPEPAACDTHDPPPDACPIWPVSATQTGVLSASKRNIELHPPTVAAAVAVAAQEEASVPRDLGAVAGETIRRNRASFDYIVQHDLWYQEGIAQRFAEGFSIDFPVAAIEIKLNWLPMSYVDDPSRYFTVEKDGELQGLVAMHISTKDLPNWFWATFEHVDNPGRCDYIGCWDSFGAEPAVVLPRAELKTTYPSETLKPALHAMMEEAGLDPAFQNYRLKGSQIDFTDSMGEPTLLGNSVTEYGFVPTSSCITCHGRAGVDWNGKKPANLRVFGEKLGGQTFNGPLDPELFYDGHQPDRRYVMQVDFVWAIPFRAQPIGGERD